MDNYEIHECEFQSNGILIVKTSDYLHKELTWQLVISREATEDDLENNHHFECVGETIWSVAAEINNCPYCSCKLRDIPISNGEFNLFN